ncbi:hypothetical protein GCM10010166_15060 [Couchioplanes caeruleus subsp. azureus]|nr:hypothetical protein GCM10010166_15060 [Couchioplanes caeruleus subsp. azureus]
MGMCRGWRARDLVAGREVAIWELVAPGWLSDEDKGRLGDRTAWAARSAGRLDHPAALRIHDVIQVRGRPWIVTDVVPPRSLHRVIVEDGPLAPADAARIGVEVLGALAAAHRIGLRHGDLSPHHVLLGEGGRVLTIFGLTVSFLEDAPGSGRGLFIGSVPFVSPERARDGVATVESDLWALGATLYAAVEGRPPHARESAMATLVALATEPPAPPRLAADLTPVLAGLLRRAPGDRLSAVEAERALRRVARGVPPGRLERHAFPRPRGLVESTVRLWLVLAAVLFLALWLLPGMVARTSSGPSVAFRPSAPQPSSGPPPRQDLGRCGVWGMRFVESHAYAGEPFTLELAGSLAAGRAGAGCVLEAKLESVPGGAASHAPSGVIRRELAASARKVSFTWQVSAEKPGPLGFTAVVTRAGGPEAAPVSHLVEVGGSRREQAGASWLYAVARSARVRAAGDVGKLRRGRPSSLAVDVAAVAPPLPAGLAPDGTLEICLRATGGATADESCTTMKVRLADGIDERRDLSLQPVSNDPVTILATVELSGTVDGREVDGYGSYSSLSTRGGPSVSLTDRLLQGGTATVAMVAALGGAGGIAAAVTAVRLFVRKLRERRKNPPRSPSDAGTEPSRAYL